MDKLDLTKAAVNLVVGSGVSTIVAKTIKNNVEIDNLFERVTVVAGSIAIGSYVGCKIKEHTNSTIDDCVKWWNENITKSEA